MFYDIVQYLQCFKILYDIYNVLKDCKIFKVFYNTLQCLQCFITLYNIYSVLKYCMIFTMI